MADIPIFVLRWITLGVSPRIMGGGSLKPCGRLSTIIAARAVYLKFAQSLSTESFISAFRRFEGRQECVSHTYSYNDKEFVGADKKLQEALED